MGYSLGDEIHKRKLNLFADLKLYDIPETLELDGEFLSELQPRFVTVALKAGMSAVSALKKLLPNTIVLGITIPTSMKQEECESMFGAPIMTMVQRLAVVGVNAGVDGLVMPAPLIIPVRGYLEEKGLRSDIIAVSPAIRPAWGHVTGDDQSPDSVLTPAKAIKAGADYLVVGRPITRADDVREATVRTIDEIAGAM
jgi:orotidine-5'-phosphate decarboxylase